MTLAAERYVVAVHKANADADMQVLSVMNAAKKRNAMPATAEKDKEAVRDILVGFARTTVWCKGPALCEFLTTALM